MGEEIEELGREKRREEEREKEDKSGLKMGREREKESLAGLVERLEGEKRMKGRRPCMQGLKRSWGRGN